jgi:methylase of polypeptide subunit release factors
LFIICSHILLMSWLVNRLRQEAAKSPSERWKSIIARVEVFAEVDESTNLSCDDRRSQGTHCRGQATKHRGLQPPAGTCEQSQSRSWSKANSLEQIIRGDVAALRAIPFEEIVMTREELRLAAIAAALVDKRLPLTTVERALIEKVGTADKKTVTEYRQRIARGHDALGDQFCLLRSREKRRVAGATYTPAKIVDAMMGWATRIGKPDRIVDPGIGSGRFTSAAAQYFPNAKLIGVDIDPLALLMARANACVQGYVHRLHLEHGDYRAVNLPACSGKTLFIGNPPYVRHHDISERWKTWFAATADRFGFKASKLAGLHIHFFLRTREIAQEGDYGSFITAAEWLDTNYGSTLRSMLADGLGGSAIHVIDPKAQPFVDAQTTAAITCFNIGRRPSYFSVRAVQRLDDLAPLDKGSTVSWEKMAASPRWSIFTREHRDVPGGFIELGEIFHAHRGQVTGANRAWIAGDEAKDIPRRYKRPTITKGRELLSASIELATTAGLKKVVDLPISLDELESWERKAVAKFLVWAKAVGAADSYVAQQRKAWWAIRLPLAAPVLVTYMARRAPAFVLNTAKARHLNIAHGLYPREPLSEKTLAAILTWLRRHVGTSGGRTYAGGLVKFEPKEIERIPIPALQDIHAAISENLERH